MTPGYSHTNECIDAIPAGMDANREDRILSIGGSGDQGFALLEYANSVTNIDREKAQTEYILDRIEALRQGEYDKFFQVYEDEVPELKTRAEKAKKYFSRTTLIEKILGRKTRLERIRGKLGSLEVKTADMHEFVRDMQSRWFSKAYLSNAVTFSKLARINQRSFIEHLAAKLRNPGIIYIADSEGVSLKGAYNIRIDEKLTRIAVEIAKGKQPWFPVVYRRKA